MSLLFFVFWVSSTGLFSRQSLEPVSARQEDSPASRYDGGEILSPNFYICRRKISRTYLYQREGIVSSLIKNRPLLQASQG
jgi:hypothetical protein